MKKENKMTKPRKPGRPKQLNTLTKVSVMLPDDAIEHLDKIASVVGVSTSTYMRMVLLGKLKEFGGRVDE
jgi:hypothetical protein